MAPHREFRQQSHATTEGILFLDYEDNNDQYVVVYIPTREGVECIPLRVYTSESYMKSAAIYSFLETLDKEKLDLIYSDPSMKTAKDLRDEIEEALLQDEEGNTSEPGPTLITFNF